MKTLILVCAGAWTAVWALAQPSPPPPPPDPPRASRARAMVLGGSSSYLGIGVLEVNAERAKALKLTEERGVEVRSVEEDSPAAKAGLKEGDVVLEYNGQRVEGAEQFIRMVRETPAGRQSRLIVSRGGATQTLTATIGQRSGTRIFGGKVVIPEIRIPEIHIPDVPRSQMAWSSSLLGIQSESLQSQLAGFFGVKEGVLVKSVVRGSAAEKAGILAGDVIVKVDGAAVSTPREISSRLRTGKAMQITLVRQKKEMNLSVTPEENRRRGWWAMPALAEAATWSVDDQDEL